MTLSFTEVNIKPSWTDRATCNIKINEVLSQVGANTNLFMRDSQSASKDGLFNSHTTSGTPWVSINLRTILILKD